MVGRSFHTAIGITALIGAVASPLAAQSTHDEWLALRTRKQTRHHQLAAAATRPDPLTITTIRFYNDPSGSIVGVGEARNDSGFDLSYSRINFRFFDVSGADLGGEWTYVFGGTNARILSNNAYETVLRPGTTGFFKVWTTIRGSTNPMYTALSAGEDLPFRAPQAAFGSSRPEEWVPLVWIARPLQIAGQRLSGTVHNDDPQGPGCPCGHPQVFTYSVRVSVASYQDGVITDVQSTLAIGPDAAGQCRGEPATGMNLHQYSSFAFDFARPTNSIGNSSVEWEEVILSREHVAFSEIGGDGNLTIMRQCGWTAVPDVPWISITDGAAADQKAGGVTFTVHRNLSPDPRFGRINLSGSSVGVSQGAACQQAIAPATIFLGAGLVDETAGSVSVPSACSIGASTDVSWLQVVPGGRDTLKISAEPNVSGVTRRGLVRIGDQSITVYQSGGGRNADFNDDGRMELLWHHGADGSVATWRMNGVQVADGTLLTPPRAADTNWTPVGAVDLDRNATTDVIWQNDADGRLSFWRMIGTTMQEGEPVSLAEAPDARVKIRAVTDVNHDGHPDFVWQRDDTGDVGVWFMRAGTYRTSPPSNPRQTGSAALGPGRVPDLNWKIAGSGDFNRDGWPDLVWQHQGDGRIGVWHMRGTTLVSGDLISPGQIFDLDWKIRGVGDINGDDGPDLIWQHRATGHISAWLMNGTTMISGISLGHVPDINWHIVGPR